MKNKKIKILFFGLGSIGLRHAGLLFKNFDVELFAYRTRRNILKIPKYIVEFYDIEKAFSLKPDIAFITNPTFLHVKTAIECAKRNINLFIEKPLSHNLKDLMLLNNLVNKKNIYSYVAFCMRFHSVIKKLKEIVKNEKVFYARSVNSSFLPKWRPTTQDYRKNFSAYSKKGGGVLLEMMHEVDYNQYLFGEIKNISGKYGKISNLMINCEDYVELDCDFNKKIKSHISLDFFSHLNERYLILYCEDKVIKADLLDNNISIYKGDTFFKKEKYHLKDINDIYLEQLKYFILNFTKKNFNIMNTVPKASKLLKSLLRFRNIA